MLVGRGGLSGVAGNSTSAREDRRCRASLPLTRGEGSVTIRRALSEPETATPEVAESELIRVRREKLAKIAALGYDAFPTTADVDTSIADVVARYGGTSH